MRQPANDGIWLRPPANTPAEPIIGFKEGIRIALWPSDSGPRGLIRIQAPYVFPKGQRCLINFIAIEPIVGGKRSLSELEWSGMDQMHGKRFWFSDEVDYSPAPKASWNTPRGVIGKIEVGGKEIETLSIVVNTEKLDNGSQPIIQAMFRADRPNEVSFKVFASRDSAPMESCVLTSTMGNYSRCRLLWLKDEVLDSRKVWPDYSGHEFVWTEDIAMERVRQEKDGSLIAAITPSETDLASVEVEKKWWEFGGKVATQYWRKYPGTFKPGLRVRVNGRAIYYGQSIQIPGGVAYENFEMIEKFEPGQEISFGVTLKTPAQMGWKKR